MTTPINHPGSIENSATIRETEMISPELYDQMYREVVYRTVRIRELQKTLHTNRKTLDDGAKGMNDISYHDALRLQDENEKIEMYIRENKMIRKNFALTLLSYIEVYDYPADITTIEITEDIEVNVAIINQHNNLLRDALY